MSHTPGPWVNDLFHVYKQGARGILAKEYSASRSVAERTANARLIAAAPELLESLKEMTALARVKWGNLDQEANVFFEKAQAAIRKAKGEL